MDQDPCPPQIPAVWPECIHRIEAMETTTRRLEELAARVERVLWLIEGMARIWDEMAGAMRQALNRLLTGAILLGLAWLALHIRIQL